MGRQGAELIWHPGALAFSCQSTVLFDVVIGGLRSHIGSSCPHSPLVFRPISPNSTDSPSVFPKAILAVFAESQAISGYTVPTAPDHQLRKGSHPDQVAVTLNDPQRDPWGRPPHVHPDVGKRVSNGSRMLDPGVSPV